MTRITVLIEDFAALPKSDSANDEHLTRWIQQARAEDLSHLHAFTRGIELDSAAAFTQRFHNGRTEGVKRQS